MILSAAVEIRARDGVTLIGDVARPDDSDTVPVPVLLQRSPYGAQRSGTAALVGLPDDPWVSLPLAIGASALSLDQVVAEGFAVCVVDCRGTHRSGGTFRWMATEATDGVDVVQWLKAQPWCDGTVLGFGGSYVSATQFATVLANPGTLAAISPWVAPSRPDTDLAGRGGVPLYATTYNWAANRVNDARVKAGLPGRDDIPLSEGTDPAPFLAQHTLSELGARLADAPEGEHVAQWVGHPTYDDYWRLLEYPEPALRRLDLPAFHLAGWYDLFLGGTLRNVVAMRRGQARDRQHLVIGPWTHVDQMRRFTTAHDFGPQSTLVGGGINDLQLEFWRDSARSARAAGATVPAAAGPATTARTIDEGSGGIVGRLPAVRLFMMGADEWRDYSDWPVPGTVATDAYLSQGESLVWGGPGASGETAIAYDPSDPAPTVGGAVLFGAPDFPGAHDQRPAEAHPGVVSFTTAPFTETLEVVGPVSLVAWVAVDPAGATPSAADEARPPAPAIDADLHATITDVAPDGTSRLLTDGVLRLSRREGLDRIVAVTAGEPMGVLVDLWATGNAFLPGHRLRLNLAGANFPRYVLSEQPVTLRVLHDAAHPSRLVLPVLPPA